MAVGLSGCAAPIIGGMTLGTLSTIVDTASSILTGKSIEEHVLSWMTGKDCNITESILRKDRKLCEEKGSVQTADDFRGIFAAFGDRDSDALTRYERARQQELAEARIASQPAQVQQANLTSFGGQESSGAVVRVGVPKPGEPVGLARLGDLIVFIMPPIYEAADLAPPAPRHRAPHVLAPVPQPKPGARVAFVPGT